MSFEEIWRMFFFTIAILSFLVGCIASAWSLARDKKLFDLIKVFNKSYSSDLTYDGKIPEKSNKNTIKSLLKTVQSHLELKFYSALVFIAIFVIIFLLPILFHKLWKWNNSFADAIEAGIKVEKQWLNKIRIVMVSLMITAFVLYFVYFYKSYNTIRDSLPSSGSMKSLYDLLKNKKISSDIIDDMNRDLLVNIIDRFENQYDASKPAAWSFLVSAICFLLTIGPEIVELILSILRFIS